MTCVLGRGRSLYNNIGWYHHDHGAYAEALRYFEEALEEHRRRGSKRKIQIARWCIARGLRSVGRVEEALRIQQQLLAEHEQSGDEDRYVYEELVECLTALGRIEESRPYQERLKKFT